MNPDPVGYKTSSGSAEVNLCRIHDDLHNILRIRNLPQPCPLTLYAK